MQRQGGGISFLRLGGAQILKVFVVEQKLPHGLKFRVRQHGKLRLAVLFQNFWMQFNHIQVSDTPRADYGHDTR